MPSQQASLISVDDTHVEHGESIIGLVEGGSLLGGDVVRMQAESILGRIEQRKRKSEVNELEVVSQSVYGFQNES